MYNEVDVNLYMCVRARACMCVFVCLVGVGVEAIKFRITVLITCYSDPLLYMYLKGSIFPKNRHFIIQESFNKLLYCINTIIKCGPDSL